MTTLTLTETFLRTLIVIAVWCFLDSLCYNKYFRCKWFLMPKVIVEFYIKRFFALRRLRSNSVLASKLESDGRIEEAREIQTYNRKEYKKLNYLNERMAANMKRYANEFATIRWIKGVLSEFGKVSAQIR